MAKNLGLTVFTTASPSHHEYIKTLGATEVFDYRDPEVKSKLTTAAKHAGVPITYGFDAISEGDTFMQCANVLAASSGHGSKLAITLPWPNEKPKPEGIAVAQVMALSLGVEQAELSAWLFNDWLKDALENKNIIPSPKIQVVEGGVRNTQKVFDMHKAGISGKKLVLKVE